MVLQPLHCLLGHATFRYNMKEIVASLNFVKNDDDDDENEGDTHRHEAPSASNPVQSNDGLMLL